MSKEKQTNTHKSILKATGVFGSVQVFKIFSSIITTKCAALFLGPSGVGVLGLLKSIINLIASVTSFGFSLTGVKEIAQHTPLDKKNITELKKSIATLKKYSIYISIIGFLVTLLFSKKISTLIFKDNSHYLWVILLATNFFFINYNTYTTAVLQGLQKMKLIAWASVSSTLTIVIATVPFYYWLGVTGIIPAILASNLLASLINLYYFKKLNIDYVKISFKEFSSKASDLLKLGFLLSINVVFGYVTNFLIKLYIENNGATEATLGYYEASIVIFTSYFGIVFSSMAIDYYPKLTSLKNNKKEMNQFVNQQIEIALLLVTPLVILMYSFSKFALKILYTSAFEKVELIFVFGLLAILMKAIIWPIGFIILANDDKRHYFYQELLGDFLNVVLSILLYKNYGLIGFGLAMLLNYSFSIIYIYYFINNKYQFTFQKKTLSIFAISFFLSVLTAFITYYFNGLLKTSLLVILILISTSYSFFLINKKTELLKFIKQKINL